MNAVDGASSLGLAMKRNVRAAPRDKMAVEIAAGISGGGGKGEEGSGEGEEG